MSRRLENAPKASLWNCDASAHRGWGLLWIGRILLILSLLSLLTMPLTQHFWTWDRFLHGGQDFETGALMLLTLLCLVLVLSKYSNGRLESLFAQRHPLVFDSNDRASRAVPPYGVLLIPGAGRFQIRPEAGSITSLYSIPLQI